MFAVISIACLAVFFALPLALLAGRMLRPANFSWPVIVASTAILGWGFLASYELAQTHAREQFERAYCDEQKMEAKRLTADGNVAVAVPGYPCRFVHYYYTFNYELGWLKALLWLVPWLCAYAILQLLRKHRAAIRGSPPNTSLERTREG